MVDVHDIKHLVGESVEITHETGMQFHGELIGLVSRPCLIVETDGRRVVYALSSLDAVKAA